MSGEAGAAQGLVKRIDGDVVQAMKARDALRVETLRMVKSALKNREIEKREPLSESEAEATLTTLIKQRRESIEQFTKGGRPELAAKEAEEIVMIERYLPQAASANDVEALIADVFAELRTAGTELNPKAMGAAMKAVYERIRQRGMRAEGRQVSELVKQALAGQ